MLPLFCWGVWSLFCCVVISVVYSFAIISLVALHLLPDDLMWLNVVTCWERADLLVLVCGVWLWVCHFPIGILGQVSFLIVSITDLCILTYFAYSVSLPRGAIGWSAVCNCWCIWIFVLIFVVDKIQAWNIDIREKCPYSIRLLSLNMYLLICFRNICGKKIEYSRK